MTLSWLTKDAARKFGRRIVFILLSLWVHAAVFFFLISVLFFGKHGSGSALRRESPAPQAAIEMSLLADNPPSLPVTAATAEAMTVSSEPQPAPATSPLAAAEQPAQSEETEKPQPAAAQPAQASMQSTQSSAQEADTDTPDGILGCESLAEKPERIIFGDDYVQFIPDGNPPGHMILHEIINREGTVIKVTVEDSTVSKKMEDQIVAWAYRSFYHPGKIGGVAVECEAKFMVVPTPYNH